MTEYFTCLPFCHRFCTTVVGGLGSNSVLVGFGCTGSACGAHAAHTVHKVCPWFTGLDKEGEIWPFAIPIIGMGWPSYSGDYVAAFLLSSLGTGYGRGCVATSLLSTRKVLTLKWTIFFIMRLVYMIGQRGRT